MSQDDPIVLPDDFEEEVPVQDALPAQPVIPSAGNYRICAKNIFLTYPQCPITNSQAIGYFNMLFPGQCHTITCAQERHQDSNFHLHAILEFNKKIDKRNPNFADLEHDGIRYHPNIQGCKNLQKSKSYVCKDGVFITTKKFDFSSETNYRKRKADFEAWQNDMSKRNQIQLQQIRLPDGSNYSLQGPGVKRRHLWIIGEPDMGKTLWLTKTFGATKFYMVPDHKYRFEGYTDHQWIIYDDIVPEWQEVASVSNTYESTQTHVFGPTRYHPVHWSPGARTMIVLSNTYPSFGAHQIAALARFRIFRLTSPVTLTPEGNLQYTNAEGFEEEPLY